MIEDLNEQPANENLSEGQTNESPIENEVQTQENEISYLSNVNPDLQWMTEKLDGIRLEMRKTVVGQHEVIDLMLISVLSNGHVLLEGVPGVAKTLSAKSLSRVLKVDFSRIQFTPDLMPSDVIGTSIFNTKEATFNFRKGPIFSNIVLIDEINRAPAKTQAALFEVMEERQITYDGTQYKLGFPFLIVATQNPIEQEGTYSLPEAQLDRFLFKINLTYPELEQEVDILRSYKSKLNGPSIDSLIPVIDSSDLQRAQNLVEAVVVEDRLLNYIAALVQKTRMHNKIYLGGSPRASISILKSSKAQATLQGRDFVTPEDIKFVFNYVLNHRIILTPEAEMDGTTSVLVLNDILKTVEIPR
jgi:MoxR-like ATPase